MKLTENSNAHRKEKNFIIHRLPSLLSSVYSYNCPVTETTSSRKHSLPSSGMKQNKKEAGAEQITESFL